MIDLAPSRSEASLADQAYAAIRRQIMTRRLAGGAILREGQLAEALKVSRTPTREALSRLEGERLIVRRSGSAYAVRHVAASEFFQTLKVRELLEPEAAGLAAGRLPSARVGELRRTIGALAGARYQAEPHWDADDAVHGMVAEGSGNPTLARVVGEMRVTTRLFELLRPFDRVQEDAAEHTAILDALERGDARASRRAMLQHLRNLERGVLLILTA